MRTLYSCINDTRLASITGNGHSYSVNYDALGRAAVRVLDGSTTYFIYDGEKAILEWSVRGRRDMDCIGRMVMQPTERERRSQYQSWSSPSGKNVYGKSIDEILMRTDYTQTPALTFYYQDDHEGSITHLTNAAGNVIERYKYHAFGAPSIFLSTVGNRFLFTGREYVANFGIYEYRNRAYHPGLGRFMSEDPKGFDAGDYNLFRYVGNDPLDKTDPLGLETLTRPEIDELVGDRVVEVAKFVGHQVAEMYRQDKVGFIILVATMGKGPKGGAKPALGEPYLPYKPFTRAQKQQLIEGATQGRSIRSETTGDKLVPGQQSKKGVTPPDNEANVHHVIPRSKGGTNSPDNAQVISRKENLEKSNKMPSPGGSYNYITVSERSDAGASSNSNETNTASETAASAEPGDGFARNLGLGGHNPRYFSPALP